MLLAACILWIGITMNAPIWFYVVLGVYALVQVFNYGQTFGKLINGKREDKE